jgi:DNA-binding NarL/FixJ family response regulator
MNFNILLVEDNSSFRQTLADTLRKHFATMNIAEVANGEDALIKAEDLCPDMIFMDINLPGENGLEATRKIKMRHEHILVAMLTSHDIPEYRQQAFRNGADYFISKAGDSCLRDIIARVEQAMADKSTRTWQENSSASSRALLWQRLSSTPVCASTLIVRIPRAILALAAFATLMANSCLASLTSQSCEF